MAYSEVNLIGLTHGPEMHEAFILVFEVKETQRIVPIFVEKEGFEMVEAALQSENYAPVRLMHLLARRLMLVPQRMRMLKPVEGGTSALVNYSRGEEEISLCVPICEAVVWALHCGVPMVISNDYIRAFSRMSSDTHAVKVPVEGMPTKLLQEALASAVEAENFELASRLRDELNQRDND